MDEQSPKPRRRWLSFSLRSLLLLVVVIAIPLAWKVRRVHNQRMAVAEIQRLHGRAISNYRPEPLTVFGKWLEGTLGNDFFSPVVQVIVDDPDITDDTIARVAKLTHLECLDLKSDKITDEGLEHIAAMHELGILRLTSATVTDAGLAQLERLRSLTQLGLWTPRITDAGITTISKLKQLEGLSLSMCCVTDNSLAQIATLTNLHRLYFGAFRQSTATEKDFMQFTDNGLINLCGLRKLEYLYLNTTAVTQSGIDKLRKALPNCEVEWNDMRTYDRKPVDEASGDSIQQPEK